MKILVVEDDLDTRDLLSELLEMEGHQIVTANESQHALEILNNHSCIDLLVTDVSLPGMSGIELAKISKSIKPLLGIIVCSGYGMKEFEALPFSVEWVQKPIEMGQFLNAVERHAGVSQ